MKSEEVQGIVLRVGDGATTSRLVVAVPTAYLVGEVFMPSPAKRRGEGGFCIAKDG